MKDAIQIYDIPLAIILIAIILIIANFYKNHKVKEHPEYKYFTLGLVTKISGAIILALVYVYYYGGGDTQYYFYGAKTLTNTFFNEPINYFRLLFSDNNEIPQDLQHITNQITYSRAPEEWFMVRITSIINFFSFNRFLISNILISLLAFFGSWKLFKSFLYFFPSYKKAAFISIFLLPSIIFWSSGILKDTITFASLGVFFYHFVKIFFKNKISIFSIIIIFITGFVIFKLKAYILLGFLPGLIIALYINFKDRIRNNLIRKISSPLLFIFIIATGYLLIINILNDSQKYKIDTLQSRIEGFHSWHTTTGGSSYNLGKVDYTVVGILKKVPASLNVTFFRPYLWEVRNITSLTGAIESSLLFILFILVLWKYKLRFIFLIFKNSFLTLSLVYSIIFGFAVGFTSYNFGALARYKVPVMPFFVFFLLYFYYKVSKKEQENITIN